MIAVAAKLEAHRPKLEVFCTVIYLELLWNLVIR